MELYKELAKMFLATEATPLKLGNVEFWIDETGPWAGQLSFCPSTVMWKPQAMGQAVADLARCYPEVSRLVLRHATAA